MKDRIEQSGIADIGRLVEALEAQVRDAGLQTDWAERLKVELARRNHIDAQVRQREREFVTLAEHAPDVISRMDRNLRHVYINPAIEAATGRRPAEFIGKTNRELGMPAHLCDLWDGKLKEVFARRQVVTFEFEFAGPAGKRCYQARLVPEVGEDGSVESVVGIARDITEQRRTERALEESRRFLNRVLTTSPNFIYVYDLVEHRNVYANKELAILLGYSPAQLEQMGERMLPALLHPDDQWLIEAMPREFGRLKDGEVIEHEYRVRRVDGQWRWLHDCKTVFSRTEEGRPREFLGIAQDITERKRAKEIIQNERQFLRKVIDTVPSLIFVKDSEGRFILGNEALARYYGSTLEQIVGKRDGDFNANAEEVEQFLRDDREVISTRRKKVIAEEKITDAEGREHYLSTVKVPLLNEDGTCDRVLGVATDITDRKRMEESLARSKQVAEEASRAKDKFLAILSHELRTPLTPVLAVATVLEKDGRLPGDVLEELAMVRRNVELEARLIDDLLDLTRIARGKLELRFQSIELGDVLAQTLKICAPDIEAKQQHVSLDLKGTQHCVRCDPSRMQQVFLNLLKNAIKFTPPGGCIGIHGYSDEQGRIVVEVRDSGAGIEPEVLPRIFDAFEQGSRSVTRDFGGLGLGLAITRALVEMHGGTITAMSAGRDQGATFRVVLQLAAAAAEASGAGPSHVNSTEKGHAQLCRKPRVLLVEDHPDTARIMSQLLRVSGYDVQTAGTKAAALETAGRGEFDLVVSDLGLPDGSGLELMRQLHERRPGLKGIALSGYGMDEDMARSRAAGFVEHLTKPVSFDRFQEAISHALEERGGG